MDSPQNSRTLGTKRGESGGEASLGPGVVREEERDPGVETDGGPVRGTGAGAGVKRGKLGSLSDQEREWQETHILVTRLMEGEGAGNLQVGRSKRGRK